MMHLDTSGPGSLHAPVEVGQAVLLVVHRPPDALIYLSWLHFQVSVLVVNAALLKARIRPCSRLPRHPSLLPMCLMYDHCTFDRERAERDRLCLCARPFFVSHLVSHLKNFK